MLAQVSLILFFIIDELLHLSDAAQASAFLRREGNAIVCWEQVQRRDKPLSDPRFEFLLTSSEGNDESRNDLTMEIIQIWSLSVNGWADFGKTCIFLELIAPALF